MARYRSVRPAFCSEVHYYRDDQRITKEEYEAANPPKDIFDAPMAVGRGAWPLRSEALGVHPSQVEEANARNAQHGIGTRYDADGTAVIPDRADRRRLNRLEGFFDKQGGYSD